MMRNELLKTIYGMDATPDSVKLHPAGRMRLLYETQPGDMDGTKPDTFFGLKVLTDKTLPRGTVEIWQDGRIIGRIENLAVEPSK